MGHHGLIHVYTGDGKGKTTASLGLAIRALGHGRRVGIFQFLKDSATRYGEMIALEAAFPQLTYVRFKHSSPYFKPGLTDEVLSKAVGEGFDEALEHVRREPFDLVVFDELNICVSRGWLPLERLLAFLRERPSSMEVVITGRDAPAGLIEAADYVTEMRLVKHPYQKGVNARQGVEF